MNWIDFWIVLSQVAIACVVLALPGGALLLMLSSAVATGIRSVAKKEKDGAVYNQLEVHNPPVTYAPGSYQRTVPLSYGDKG